MKFNISSLLPVIRRGFLQAGAIGLPVISLRLRPSKALRFAVTVLLAVLAPGLYAQQYLLAPVAHQQFFTNTGVIAAGYKLCTFTAGTTTPLALASDSSG